MHTTWDRFNKFLISLFPSQWRSTNSEEWNANSGTKVLKSFSKFHDFFAKLCKSEFSYTPFVWDESITLIYFLNIRKLIVFFNIMEIRIQWWRTHIMSKLSFTENPLISRWNLTMCKVKKASIKISYDPQIRCLLEYR